MILAKRVFRRDTWCWAAGDIHDYCGGIERWVRGHFELPRKISRVIITLHNRPAVNRERMRVRGPKHGLSDRPYVVLQASTASFATYSLSLTRLLKPVIGRTVYLQVEYE